MRVVSFIKSLRHHRGDVVSVKDIGTAVFMLDTAVGTKVEASSGGLVMASAYTTSRESLVSGGARAVVSGTSSLVTVTIGAGCFASASSSVSSSGSASRSANVRHNGHENPG